MPSPSGDAAQAVARSFREVLARSCVPGAPPPPRPVLLAVSGGLDSVVLLDLFLRLSGEFGVRLHVAHFDHAMRPGSADDAEWVRRLCEERGVSLSVARADRSPGSETTAREARWEFLHAAAGGIGAWRIATAHHADDQAETVLFRIVRGTGLHGLAGMSEDDGRVLRPLLGLYREALESYAAGRSLAWREDPSNADPTPARNRLRREVLPLIEAHVAPGARRALVRLAGHVRERSDPGDDPARVFRLLDPAAAVVTRREFARHDPAVRRRIVRDTLRSFGVVPDAAGTRSLVEFITDASSGRTMELPGGVRARTELGTVRIERDRPIPADVAFRFAPPAAGEAVSGLARLGGRLWRVQAEGGPGPDRDGATTVVARSPWYRVRGWQPGDRIVTRAGTRKLKEIFRERRVPARERGSVPVLADAEDGVIWVRGGPEAAERASGEREFSVRIADA